MKQRIVKITVQLIVSPQNDWMEGEDPIVEIEQREELVQMLIEQGSRELEKIAEGYGWFAEMATADVDFKVSGKPSTWVSGSKAGDDRKGYIRSSKGTSSF